MGIGGARLPLVGQPPHHRIGEHAQPFTLQIGQPLGARLEIDHAQRAERSALARNQRRAGVKPHPRFAGDQRIVRKARVQCGIRHHHRRAPEHGMGAEAGRARGLAIFHPGPGQEPLAVFLDHGDQ